MCGFGPLITPPGRGLAPLVLVMREWRKKGVFAPGDEPTGWCIFVTNISSYVKGHALVREFYPSVTLQSVSYITIMPMNRAGGPGRGENMRMLCQMINIKKTGLPS